MSKIYAPAETPENMAKNLIPMYHPELATARIRYVFVDKASMKNGKPVRGKVRKITGIIEHLVETDFLFEIALDQWNEATEHQRNALIDHLLERCTGEENEEDGAMKWTMREPDVQEFATILRRQGAWTDDLVAFATVAKQINIDEVVGEAVEEVSQRQS